MNADNNLEGAGLDDLEEMASVGSTDKVNIVVQSDRAVEWAEGGVLNLSDWKSAKRLFVEKGRLKELADLGEVNMDDPRTLTDFLGWAKGAYPAKRYALIFWDHGANFLGYGNDSTGGKDSTMRIPALANALKQSQMRFAFLAFDACVMSSLEVAMEVQPYAQVLAVSEENEPGPGQDYAAVLRALTGRPTLSELDFGKAMADSYMSFYKINSPAEALYATFTVIDLTEIPKVATAFGSFGSDINRYVMGGGKADLTRLGQVVGQARYETPAFFRRAFNDPGLVFDLGLLADNAAKVTRDGQIIKSADELKKALAKTILYSLAGDGFKATSLSGLTIHLPVYGTEAPFVEAYDQLAEIKKTKWPEYMKALAQAANQDKQNPTVGALTNSAAAVIPGRNKANISGSVADETLVTGVVVGVTGLLGKHTVLLGFEEQARTYRATNPYNYSFDGMGWYLNDGSDSQLVFSVQWRPSQRAIFGVYRQAPGHKPQLVYLVYDEATGNFVQGFDTSGAWIGAILPDEKSLFTPFLLTPDPSSAFPFPGLSVIDANDPVLVRKAKLKKGPLPDGAYVVTVTGFDLGNNAASASTTIAVANSRAQPGACEPDDIDAASAIGRHNLKFELGNRQKVVLGLRLDRNKVASVRLIVEIVRGDARAELKVIGPDGQTVVGGRLQGRSADTFQPEISGLYQLVLEDTTGGPKNVELEWFVSAKEGTQPTIIDLDRNPNQLGLLEQPGLHAARLTVEGGKQVSMNLTLDKARTPWVAYSVEVSQPIAFAVISPDKQQLDLAPVCSLHMGGFQVSANGDHSFIFDNRQSRENRAVTIWVEGYTPGGVSGEVAETVSDWCSTDRTLEIEIRPNQVLRLASPCDASRTAAVTFNLRGGSGRTPIKYQALSPSGQPLRAGVLEALAIETFPVAASGRYVLVLDNSANNTGRPLTVTFTITGRTQTTATPGLTPTVAPTPGVTATVAAPTPSVTGTPRPTVTPVPTPTVESIITQRLAGWCAGEHSQEFTIPAGREMRLVITCDSATVSRATFTLGGSGGRIGFQALGPNGSTLVSGTHTSLSQESFSITDSGDYVIVLDNRGNPSTRSVTVTISVRNR